MLKLLAVSQALVVYVSQELFAELAKFEIDMLVVPSYTTKSCKEQYESLHYHLVSKKDRIVRGNS